MKIKLFGSEDLGVSYNLLKETEDISSCNIDIIKQIEQEYSRWYITVDDKVVYVSKTLYEPMKVILNGNAIFVTSDKFLLSIAKEDIINILKFKGFNN